MLPNDTTPGSVTQVDYNVWRANFGRSAAASGASMPEVVAQADGRNEDVFVVSALAGSDRLKAELRTRNERPVQFRSARREGLANRTFQDHALQAWLTSRLTARWSESGAADYSEHPHDGESEATSETVAALDVAFAAL